MSVRHETLIALVSIALLILVTTPLTLFLQDLANGNIYFKITKTNTEIILSLYHEGLSYLKDIKYNATIKDLLGNIYTKTGIIDKFKRGDVINITIPLKTPTTFPVDVYLKVSAKVGNLYELSFEVKRSG